MSGATNGKPPNGHGQGITGEVARTTGKLIESLPAQFLALTLLNAMYAIGILWFLDAQQERRDKNVAPIIASCLRQVPIEVVERLLGTRIAPIDPGPAVKDKDHP